MTHKLQGGSTPPTTAGMPPENCAGAIPQHRSTSPATHKEVIAASWQRCGDYGLTPGTLPALGSLSSAEIGDLLACHQTLINTTHKEVLPYYENILAQSNCMMLLADGLGHVLHTWRERPLAGKRFCKLSVGHQWTEARAGTNAIGTALAVGEAVQVGREEHFLKANRCMVGSASPIFNPDREVVGVLDISSDAYLPQDHTLGLVKLITLSVENRLIYNKFAAGHVLVSFSTSPSSLTSPWAGLLVLDNQGRVTAANRRAEITRARDLARVDIGSLFDLGMQALQRHPRGQPLSVVALGKYRMNMMVHLPASDAIVSVGQLPLKGALPAGADNVELLPPDVVPLTELSHGDERVARTVAQASRIMEKDIPILLHGETGSGKEVVVKSLHYHSGRRRFPLVAVNCAAIPSELVESELFGYARGAFTGASSKGAIGLIRKAHCGTLFLDEIGEMPLNVQARLLRVLQERRVTPLGSTESYPVDIKLISATNRNLKAEIRAGCFRGDLYYRICGLNLELPPLRARTDKRRLIEYIHKRQMKNAGETYQPLNTEILDLLERHPWPGNVRQFISVLGVALAMADGSPISYWDLPDSFFEDLPTSCDGGAGKAPSTGSPAQSEHNSVAAGAVQEDEMRQESCADTASRILRLYQQHRGNVSRTARAAGVSRNTVYKYTRGIKLS